MITDNVEGLAASYAVDALDDAERASFEAHLATCHQCQAEVTSLRAAVTELTLLTVTSPPPDLRAAVLRDISAIRPLPPALPSVADAGFQPVAASGMSTPRPPADLGSRRDQSARRVPHLRQWLAGAAAAAVLAVGGLGWHPWSSGTNPVQITAMQHLLNARDVHRFSTKVGAATATVVRSASLNTAAVTTAALPAAPHGKVYELWLQQGDTMVKAGFLPDARASTVLLQGDAATATGVAITVEPAGGSPTPSLPPLALITFA